MKKLENINFSKFEDEFGNLKEEFDVIVYTKLSNGEWVEDKKTTSGRSYYIEDNRLYYRSGDTLLPLNMDFNSKTCGACYQIGDVIQDKRKITNNEILFETKLDTKIKRQLHKQSYSDGTHYYTLKDQNGMWDLRYGSCNIDDIIYAVECDIEINSSSQNYKGSTVDWLNDILNNLHLAKSL